ncbi:MAG: aldo/keto reductase [Ignavibacteria bacterium]|nr:aldo/keto reductase [Ignavibacteria bacterium]
MDFRVKEHYNSLYKAIVSGIRLIDTASNYSDGASELLVGNVINDLIRDGIISRKDITIITKAGYIQGQNYKFALKKKLLKEPFKDVIEYSEKTWYSISPDFLSDQLERQLERLIQSEENRYIDGYLLHNPEIFLDFQEKSSGINYTKLEYDIQTEYYRRIKKAFEFLEEQVKTGNIKYYGVSSNTFPFRSNRYDFTSLERLIKIANEVSSKNHFRYIEFPFNIIESNAFFEKNQKNNSKTLLEIASKSGLIVLTNRPLNAITEQGLVRLVEYSQGKFSEEEFQNSLKDAIELESRLIKQELQYIALVKEKKRDNPIFFTLINKIKENWNRFSSIEHLTYYIENYFFPKILYILNYFNFDISALKLSGNTVITPERLLSFEVGDVDFQEIEPFEERLIFKQYLEKYLKVIDTLLSQLMDYYKAISNNRNKEISNIIDEFYVKSHCKIYPKGLDFKTLSLSQKVIQIIRSVPGVNYVLVGARNENYVNELIELMNYENITNIEKLLENIRTEFIKKNFIKE